MKLQLQVGSVLVFRTLHFSLLYGCPCTTFLRNTIQCKLKNREVRNVSPACKEVRSYTDRYRCRRVPVLSSSACKTCSSAVSEKSLQCSNSTIACARLQCAIGFGAIRSCNFSRNESTVQSCAHARYATQWHGVCMASYCNREAVVRWV